MAGKVATAAIFKNPFNKDSAHHTPIGDGVKYGIPPGTLRCLVEHPVYQPGKEGSRGRLERVKTFRAGSTAQGTKYVHYVKSDDRQFACDWHRKGGTGKGLPMMGRAPTGKSYGSEKGGDNAVLLYPHMGNAEVDLADNFTQFQWITEIKATARQCRQYPLASRDVRNRYNDGGVWGSGAIQWRHPGGFLRGAECDLSGKTPIQHLLNCTATRHSGQEQVQNHVLARSMAYPAWQTDIPLDGNDNAGDLPYGTVIVLPWEDRQMIDKIGLSPFGRTLARTFMHHGCCICDGQGAEIDGGAVLQLRVDHDVSANAALEAEVEDALGKLLPHLWPVFNPRRHDQDAVRHSDGLIYVGGGGPISPNAINNAWDAGAGPIEPPVEPPTEPPPVVEPPIEVEPPGHIVTCPNCQAQFRMTFSELEASKLAAG